MHLPITSDYFQSEGDPQLYLKRIADSGLTHIHWYHHWADDFIYSDHEVKQIERWLKEYGLNLLASHGKEKFWLSMSEYQRLAGDKLTTMIESKRLAKKPGEAQVYLLLI